MGPKAHQPLRGSGSELEDPDCEGYDPDGEDGVILMDLCEDDQNKWRHSALQSSAVNKDYQFQR